VYFLYTLKCADETLYIGITNELQRRVNEHNSSNFGAKYTRGRRPVELVFSKKFENRAAALKEEFRIKKLSKEKKLKIIHNAL
jgi:putative endonuclease